MIFEYRILTDFLYTIQNLQTNDKHPEIFLFMQRHQVQSDTT